MPKASKQKMLKAKVVHPNSRQAHYMARQKHHDSRIEKNKGVAQVKQQIKVERLLWFQENMDKSKEQLAPAELLDLIEKYLDRFSDELASIMELHRMKNRQPSQNVSRVDNIRFTTESEKEQFTTTGLDVPDLLNKRSMEFFKVWNGEAKYIPSIKTKLFTRLMLDNLLKK